MDTKDNNSPNYILPTGGKKTIQPGPGSDNTIGASPAVELIRQKLDNLYAQEPAAKEELAEAEKQGRHRSKHQQFMYGLGNSGKPLAEIQTEWHNYYVNLPDAEKHQVWQEFYQTHGQSNHFAKPVQQGPASQTAASSADSATTHHPEPTKTKHDRRTTADIRRQLTGKVGQRRKLQAKEHARSLIFGLGMGSIAIVILLFSFFNERFIAPFVTPSRSVSNTPLIIDPGTTATGKDPLIIIPKINVEIPVVYTEPSIEEHAVQKALENGVLHYATTPNPGETGNGAIFGHSSNNILNSGKYKFAFVLLKRLENGDTFILQKDGKRYVYRVFDKKIVKPEDVGVLAGADKPSTFSLITCDPPGTSINRLVVIGEQVSPDPNLNVASKTNPSTALKPAVLPSNSETLWHRLTNWLTS